MGESVNVNHLGERMVEKKFKCRECGPVDDPMPCRSRGHVVSRKKHYAKNHGLQKRCQCSRRLWEDCRHAWCFKFRFRGQLFRGYLGQISRDAARIEFEHIKGNIMAGTYVKKSAVKTGTGLGIEAPTFKIVAERYAESHIKARLSPAAAKLHQYRMDFLTGVVVPPGVPFTDKPFRTITLDDIDIALIAKRTPVEKTYGNGEKKYKRTVGGSVSANRLRDHLCGLWNWALERGYTDSTPFNRGGRVPTELKKSSEHHRTRRLREGEEQRLLENAESHLKDSIIADLESGMRKNELLSLQWKHVRWLQNELLLEWTNTKTKKSRQIPLSPTLRELLSRRQHDCFASLPRAFSPAVSEAERIAELYVFGNAIGERIGDNKTAWSKMCQRANIKDLHFHDLRREAGSRKLEQGWELHAVQLWLGHTKLETTAKYLCVDALYLHKLNERTRPVLVK
jgi:integrase